MAIVFNPSRAIAVNRLEIVCGDLGHDARAWGVLSGNGGPL